MFPKYYLSDDAFNLLQGYSNEVEHTLIHFASNSTEVDACLAANKFAKRLCYSYPDMSSINKQKGQVNPSLKEKSH
jgi:hypothetical protein